MNSLKYFQNNNQFIAIAIFVVIFVIAGGWYFFQQNPETTAEKSPGDTIDKISIDEAFAPLLKIGDEWIHRVNNDGDVYTASTQIVAQEMLDEESIYRQRVVLDPPIFGPASNMEIWLNAETLYPIRAQFVVESGGRTNILGTILAYDWDEKPFPYRVGKKVRFVETTNESIDTTGEALEIPQDIITKILTVEAKEEITVPAGTFDTFKLVTRDEEGNLIATTWYSDAVKTDVKSIRETTGEIFELTDYSVQ